MGEAEFDSLLDVVRANMSAAPATDEMLAREISDLIVVPVAANDNEGPWPHFAFPEGWVASS